jgi:hypothetical protein
MARHLRPGARWWAGAAERQNFAPDDRLGVAVAHDARDVLMGHIDDLGDVPHGQLGGVGLTDSLVALSSPRFLFALGLRRAARQRLGAPL